MQNQRLQNMVRCALAAAILCVTAQISLPVGDAPITIQPFALALVERFCGAEARQCVAAELVWTE